MYHPIVRLLVDRKWKKFAKYDTRWEIFERISHLSHFESDRSEVNLIQSIFEVYPLSNPKSNLKSTRSWSEIYPWPILVDTFYGVAKFAWSNFLKPHIFLQDSFICVYLLRDLHVLLRVPTATTAHGKRHQTYQMGIRVFHYLVCTLLHVWRIQRDGEVGDLYLPPWAGPLPAATSTFFVRLRGVEKC